MPKRGLPTDFESFLTWEALVEVLSYDPGTGEFRWIKSDRPAWIGRVAGNVDPYRGGYRAIRLSGHRYSASRLAWLYQEKQWPAGVIDHINGNRADNRWENLRDIPQAENAQNRHPGLISKRIASPQLRLAKTVSRRGNPADANSGLTRGMLMRALSYDPATGEFRWLETSNGDVKVGPIAGKTNKKGYRVIGLGGRTLYAHRLAWLYVTGKWPKDLVDHKDGNPSNNEWLNLRPATRAQNNANRIATPGKSGITGVYLERGRWRAGVSVGNKMVHLGSYDSKEEAASARAAFDERNRGEFRSREVDAPDADLVTQVFESTEYLSKRNNT